MPQEELSNQRRCFWYLLDYECSEEEWTYTKETTTELRITNPDGTKSPIKQKKVTESKKTLGIYDSPSGGNEGHLSYIVKKATQWVNRMKKRPPSKPHCMDGL
jgi:hypothetical protein